MINHRSLSLSTFSSGGKILDTLGRWWDPFLHPRDRKGRFIETFGSIKIGLSSGGPSDDISASILFVDGNTSEVLAVIRDILSPDAKSKGFEVGDIVQTPKEYFDVIGEKARLDTPIERSEENVPDGLKEIIADTTKYTFKDINGDLIDNPFDEAVKAKIDEAPEQPVVVPPRPVAPAFKGDELVALVESAGGDPEKLIQSLRDEELTIFDYETVGDGTFGKESTPIQIGAKKIKNGEVIDSFVKFINPGKPLGSFYYETEKDEKGWDKKDDNGEVIYILDDNGEKILKGELKTDDGSVVDDAFLATQESLEDVHRQFAEWLGDDYILVGHNIISFDEPILAYQLEQAGVDYNPPAIIDTLNLSRSVNGDNGNKLTQLTEKYGIEHSAAHNAASDALATEQVLFKILEDMKRLDVGTDQLDPKAFEEVYKEKMAEFILAKKAEKEAKAKLSSKSSTAAEPAQEVQATTNGAGWKAVLTDEALSLDNPKEAHPERYYTKDEKPNVGLKDGYLETKVVRKKRDPDKDYIEWLIEGIPEPVRIRDYETHTSAGLTWKEVAEEAEKTENFLSPPYFYNFKFGIPVGEDRPPKHVYRVMSTKEFDAAQERGWIQSDENMNLGPEGTVASLYSTVAFYLPVDRTDYRIVRIKYADEDGWRRDAVDSYIKTNEKIPFDRVDLFTTPISQSSSSKKVIDPEPAPEPAPEVKSSPDSEEPKPTSLWDPPPALDPVESMKTGAEGYAESIGKTLDNTGLDTVSVTPDVTIALAQAYDNLPNYNEAAVPYFEAFRDETAEQYKYLTEVLGVKVEVTSEDPYANIEELFADLRDNNRIKVLSAESTGEVPMFSSEQIEMFRAVHDAFGHAAIGRGFDRHGEEAAFRAHAQMYSDDAALALESVTRGQNASLIFNGKFPTQKIAILPRELSEVNVPKDTTPEQKTTSLIAEAPPEPNSKAQAMSIVRQYSGDVYNEDSSANPTITSVISEEDIPVSRIFKVNDEVKAWFESAGIPTSDFYEVDNDEEELDSDEEAKGYKQFQRLVEAAKKKLKFGSSVAVLEDPGFPDSDIAYYGTRQFVSSDGGAGFALNGDEIISGFSNGEGVNAGAADAMLQLAVQLGGRRLDAFDTVLPEMYARSGFVTTARIPFNDEFPPEDWDFEEYKEFNNGRPDVVFMAYNPNMRVLDGYKQGDGKTFESYDEAAEYNKEKAADYSQSPQTDPPLLGGYEISPDAPEQTFVNYDSKFDSVALSADESTVTIDDTQRDKASLTDIQRTLLSAKELQDEGRGEPVDDGPPSDWDGDDYYESTYDRQHNLMSKLPFYAIDFVGSWPDTFEFVAKMRGMAEVLLSTPPDRRGTLNMQQKTALAGLDLVENSPETTEVLWRGMSVSDATLSSLIRANTMSISLAAFSSARSEVDQYTTFHSAKSRKIILKLEPGAKAIPMVGLTPSAIIGEHVTSGEFEIIRTEYDDATDGRIITIRQISTFDLSADNSDKFSNTPIGAANETDIAQVQTRVIQSRLGSEVESALDGEIKNLVATSIAEKLSDLPVVDLLGASLGNVYRNLISAMTPGEAAAETEGIQVETLIDHLNTLDKSENKSSSVRKFFRKSFSTTGEKLFHPVFRFDAQPEPGQPEIKVGLSQDEIAEIIKIAQETVRPEDAVPGRTDPNADPDILEYDFTGRLRTELMRVTLELDLINRSRSANENPLVSGDPIPLPTTEEMKALNKELFSLGIASYAIRSPEDELFAMNPFIGTLDDLANLISEKFFDVTTDEGKQYLQEIAVSGLVRNWAISSNDNNPMSLAIQKAAEEEFGIEGAFQWSPSLADTQIKTDALLSKYSNVYKRFVRAQYDNTQEALSDAEIEYVEAYRGYSTEYDSEVHNIAADITAHLRPLSSFSTSSETAREFMNSDDSNSFFEEEVSMVIKSLVPKEQILSFSFTGVGCTSEKEMVVLGPELAGKIIAIQGDGEEDDF